MKKTVLIAVVLTTMACATAAWCQGPPPGGPGGPGGHGGPMMPSVTMAVMPPCADMLSRLTDTLQLTDDQVAKLKDILAKADETIQPLSKTAADASRSLHEAVLAADFDATNVATLATKAEKAEADVVTASISVWAQVRAALTADQITKLQDALKPGPPPQQ